MFQTSSSAIMRVTLKFNKIIHIYIYVYITINTMDLCKLNVCLIYQDLSKTVTCRNLKQVVFLSINYIRLNDKKIVP